MKNDETLSAIRFELQRTRRVLQSLAGTLDAAANGNILPAHLRHQAESTREMARRLGDAAQQATGMMDDPTGEKPLGQSIAAAVAARDSDRLESLAIRAGTYGALCRAAATAGVDPDELEEALAAI